MGKSVDNQVKDETLSDADVDVCDGCFNEFEKHEIRECRKCGERMCHFCMELHECDDEYSKRPKKGLDKPKKI